MTTKITKLTAEQVAAMPGHAHGVVERALEVRPADRARAERGILAHYRLAGLPEPRVIVWVTQGPVWGHRAREMTLRALDRCRAQVDDQVGAQVFTQIRDQVYKRVAEQVDAQIPKQVAEQVCEQVCDQVNAQVDEQIRAQVGEQVSAQAHAQVYAQVVVQVTEQVNAQIRAQVGEQVDEQVSMQVDEQVDEQIRAQVGEQVNAQVGEQIAEQVAEQVRTRVYTQVAEQIRDQVNAQARAQVSARVYAQVAEQVTAPVNDQVNVQVADQVAIQVREQVSMQIGEQIGEQIREQVSQQVRKVGALDWYAYCGGSWWSAWPVSYGTYYRDVCGLSLDWLDAAEDVTECGWWYPHRGFVVVVDRPTALCRDELGRLHCATGPSIDYHGAWSLYYWHGVCVPREWIMCPKTIDARTVLAEENIEKRRVGMEIMLANGGAGLLEQLGAREIDRDTDPMIGTLYVADLPDAPATKLLHVRCGTGREFVLFVDPKATTALEGNASTYEGISPRELREMMQART